MTYKIAFIIGAGTQWDYEYYRTSFSPKALLAECKEPDAMRRLLKKYAVPCAEHHNLEEANAVYTLEERQEFGWRFMPLLWVTTKRNHNRNRD